MLQEVGEPQRARREAEPGQIGAIRAQLAPDHRLVDPHHGVVLQRDHGERQHARRHAALAPFDEDRVRGASAPRLQRIRRAIVAPRHQDDRRGFDDVAVFDGALAGDAGGVGADRIGGELDGPKTQHEQARAAAHRGQRQTRQAEPGGELFGCGDVGERHDDLARQEHELARRRDAVARSDGERLGLGPLAHEQAQRDAAAGGLAEVGLACEEVLLVADQIARGEEAAVEVARPLAARIFDEDSCPAKCREILCRDALAGGAVSQSHIGSFADRL